MAIVGSGPIGLAALLTAQFYSPAEIIMIDLDDKRLDIARGATRTINSTVHDPTGCNSSVPLPDRKFKRGEVLKSLSVEMSL